MAPSFFPLFCMECTELYPHLGPCSFVDKGSECSIQFHQTAACHQFCQAACTRAGRCTCPLQGALTRQEGRTASRRHQGALFIHKSIMAAPVLRLWQVIFNFLYRWFAPLSNFMCSLFQVHPEFDGTNRICGKVPRWPEGSVWVSVLFLQIKTKLFVTLSPPEAQEIKCHFVTRMHQSAEWLDQFKKRKWSVYTTRQTCFYVATHFPLFPKAVSYER